MLPRPPEASPMRCVKVLLHWRLAGRPCALRRNPARRRTARLHAVPLPSTAIVPYRSRKKKHRAHTQHHKERAADDLGIEGSAAAVQFAKNENSPKQSPELVGIRKRDAAADADILRGVLLKQVSDNPDEASEHQPEKHVA